MRGLAKRVTIILASRWFLRGVLIFFAFEALWVAFSAVYPMAFDEDFHFGVIKIYSHQWSPFLAAQPENSSQYGSLVSDPSYLYYYLISFPYRFIQLFAQNQTAQVICLRVINVSLAVWGVALFAKVLRRVGSSPALTNTALALFVLIPIVPLLAGQINYDNLLLPLVALMCLLVFDIYSQLRRNQINVKTLALFAALSMLAALVKYAFLPVVLAAAVFILLVAARQYWNNAGKFKNAFHKGYTALSRRAKFGLTVLLLISFGLFVQRYGVNLVRYHTPVPECDEVLLEKECAAYAPWVRNRNYALDHSKDGTKNTNPLAYTWQWLQSLHYRLFFMINGPADSYRNFPPMPLPAAAAVIIGIFGTTAMIFNWRSVFRGNELLIFLFGLCLLYCGVLWADNYSQFIETGRPVAINGRYLLPILLPLAAVYGKALKVVLARRVNLKAVCAVVAILLFVQGGGVISFILRSDKAWYWPEPTVLHVNNAAHKVLAPIIIEGGQFYD